LSTGTPSSAPFDAISLVPLSASVSTLAMFWVTGGLGCSTASSPFFTTGGL